jgi:hypothetical protein
MNKAEIKNELEFIDSSIVEVVIECCKELYCNSVPLYEWDYNSVMGVFDKVIQDWED